jgi:hypothetical protein
MGPLITFMIVTILLGVSLSSNIGKITQSKKEQLALVVIMFALLLVAGLVFRVFDPLLTLLT